MKIRRALTEKGFSIDGISDTILDIELGDEIKSISDNPYLFDGFEIECSDKTVTINLTEPKYKTGESEFTPFCIIEIGEDGYVFKEKGFDENCKLIYEYDC